MNHELPAGSPLFQRFLLLLTLLVAAFFCFCNIDHQSVVRKSDELIHVEVVQEMVHDGHLFVPTWYGKPYLNKPPLKTWLSAVFVSIAGDSNWSFRFIDGLSGVGVVALVFLFCLRFFNSPIAGVLAGIALCGARPFVIGDHGVRHATQDPFMLLLCTAAIVIGLEISRTYRGESSNSAGERKLHLAFGVLISAAVLTKSVAGAVPLLIFGAFLLCDPLSRAGAIKRRRLWAESLLLGFLPAIIYVSYHLIFNFDLFLFTARVEVVDRALTGFHNRLRDFYYWRELFMRDSLATPLLLGSALIYIAFRALKDPKYKFLLCWSIVPIVLYSAARSRMPWYILIAYPGMAAAIGLFVAELLEQKKWRRITLVFGLFFAGLLFFRAERIGVHVVRVKQNQLDHFISLIRRQGTRPRAIVGNPFKVDPVLVNNLGRVDLIYLRMFDGTTVTAVEAQQSGWKTVMCEAADCDEVKAKRGEPRDTVVLPAKGGHRPVISALLY